VEEEPNSPGAVLSEIAQASKSAPFMMPDVGNSKPSSKKAPIPDDTPLFEMFGNSSSQQAASASAIAADEEEEEEADSEPKDAWSAALDNLEQVTAKPDAKGKAAAEKNKSKAKKPTLNQLSANVTFSSFGSNTTATTTTPSPPPPTGNPNVNPYGLPSGGYGTTPNPYGYGFQPNTAAPSAGQTGGGYGMQTGGSFGMMDFAVNSKPATTAKQKDAFSNLNIWN